MPAGRPKFKIDYEQVKGLASLLCTQAEIASFLGCDVRTLQRDEEFCRTYKEGIDQGKMSLRRKQFALADKSAAMAIFLGKNILGQRDQQDLAHSGDIGVKINFVPVKKNGS